MKIVIILFVLFSTLINAEIVKDKAIVWDDDKKVQLLLLQDSVKVQVDPVTDHWYRMSLIVFVSEKDFFKNEMKINKGAILKNSFGKRLGVTLNHIDVSFYEFSGGMIEALISAVQIKQEDIYPDSDIEFQFSNLLLSDSITLGDFQNHFKYNGYFAWIDSSIFKSYMVYGALTEPPIIRILAVFDAEKLFCIIHYSHKTYPTCKSRTSIRELQVSYFSEDKKKLKEFEDIYFPIIQMGD